MTIGEALLADDADSVSDAAALSFRRFADATGADRHALAACIMPSNTRITPEIVRAIGVPVLVVVGSNDEIAGEAGPLADMIEIGEAVTLPGLDHMKATGAPGFKEATLEFLGRHPLT